MAYTTQDIGKECPYCQAGKITQYRSGKLGCDKYCWKNKEPNTLSTPYMPKVNRQDAIDKSVKEGRELRERQGYSARLGGAMHDAVQISIAILNREKGPLYTRDDMETELDYWFDSIIEKLESRENPRVDGLKVSEEFHEKMDEIEKFQKGAEIEDANTELQTIEEIDIKDTPF